MPTIYNTINLEAHTSDGSDENFSRHARKRIELTIGDIAESRADLLISSSSVDQIPNGHVVKRLESYHGEMLTIRNFHPLKLFQTPRYPNSNMGIWLKRSALSTGQTLLLFAVTPKADFHDGFLAPLASLIDLLRHIDQGSLNLPSDLEAPLPPLSIALPILGGNRDFPRLDLMRALIEKLSELIRGSTHLEVVSLYVFENREAEIWSKELEGALGRERSQRGQIELRELSETLKDNLLTCINTLRLIPKVTTSKLKHEVLVPLRVHLIHEPACVATLSTFGRKSWEAIIIHFMNALDIQPTSKLTGVFDALKKEFEARKMISSWVSLSLIKELGNAAAHIQGTNHLSMRDYPILLFALGNSLGLVDPFKVNAPSTKRALINTWIKEIEDEIGALLKIHGGDYLLPALSDLNDNDRKKFLVLWVDRVMSSHENHPYWDKNNRGHFMPKNVNLGNLRTVLSDVIPKWITIHHWLWAFHSVQWDECIDQDWVKLYDTLTRWRLMCFAIDMR